MCGSLLILKAIANSQALQGRWGMHGAGRRWVRGGGGVREDAVPALLIPGIVPLDEAFGALQLRMETVLLAPVPGHTLGGDAETQQDGDRVRCLNNSLQDQSTERPRPSLKFQGLSPRSAF